jgi:hypothetical protein
MPAIVAQASAQEAGYVAADVVNKAKHWPISRLITLMCRS